MDRFRPPIVYTFENWPCIILLEYNPCFWPEERQMPKFSSNYLRDFPSFLLFIHYVLRLLRYEV